MSNIIAGAIILAGVMLIGLIIVLAASWIDEEPNHGSGDDE